MIGLRWKLTGKLSWQVLKRKSLIESYKFFSVVYCKFLEPCVVIYVSESIIIRATDTNFISIKIENL